MQEEVCLEGIFSDICHVYLEKQSTQKVRCGSGVCLHVAIVFLALKVFSEVIYRMNCPVDSFNNPYDSIFLLILQGPIA